MCFFFFFFFNWALPSPQSKHLWSWVDHYTKKKSSVYLLSSSNFVPLCLLITFQRYILSPQRLDLTANNRKLLLEGNATWAASGSRDLREWNVDHSLDIEVFWCLHSLSNPLWQFLSLSLSLTHTHTHTHARARTFFLHLTHDHPHTFCFFSTPSFFDKKKSPEVLFFCPDVRALLLTDIIVLLTEKDNHFHLALMIDTRVSV